MSSGFFPQPTFKLILSNNINIAKFNGDFPFFKKKCHLYPLPPLTLQMAFSFSSTPIISLSFAVPCLLFVCAIIQWLSKAGIASLSYYPSEYLQYPWVIRIYSSSFDHYFMTIILQKTSFILISFSPRLNIAYQNVHWIQIYQNKIKQAKNKKKKKSPENTY